MLDKLAPHSRVWIFQSDRFLAEQDIHTIAAVMKEFLPQWASHGNDLYGDYAVAENLFLIVGVDEKKALTSGCSVDELNRVIKQIGKMIQAEFFDRLRVAFHDKSGELKHLPMFEFKALMKKDEVTGSTYVYNNLIESKADLETKWKTTVKNSWHKNLIEIL
ncbi:MAG: hypothetical protein IPM74_04755 [Crocinitomicaceae bacterium]|nr:hypothetical protein [Crocinitomicaceae bacterium]MBK8925215.1 hypothetical protein [Crocinitomicaceae bacterium]